MATIFPQETLHDFAEAMDRLQEIHVRHFERVLNNGKMPAIRANIRGQISTVESKLRAVIEIERRKIK